MDQVNQIVLFATVGKATACLEILMMMAMCLFFGGKGFGQWHGMAWRGLGWWDEDDMPNPHGRWTLDLGFTGVC